MIAVALLLLTANAPAPVNTTPPTPTNAPTTPNAPATTTASAPATTSWRLEEIRRRFDNNECDKIVADADALTHDITLSDADHRDVLFIEGYCQVALGNDTAATKIFEALVREDVEWKPSFPIETRISDRLEGARAREKKARDDAAMAERKKLMDSVKLTVHAPLNLTGGQRAVFDVDVVDPNHVVKSMRLDFVKDGQREPYGIPALQKPDGTWRAEIAGSYTRTRKAAHIRWFVTASDDVGVVANVGTKAKPEVLDIKAGDEVAQDLTATERLSKPARFFYALFAAPGISAAGFAAGFGVTLFTQLELDQNNEAPFLNPVLVASFALLPPALALAGLGVSTQFLLDGTDFWIPIGVVASALSIYAIACIVGAVQLANAQNGYPLPHFSIGDGSQTFGKATGLIGAPIGAGLAFVAAIVVPTAIVGIDNAKETWFDTPDEMNAAVPAATTTTKAPAKSKP